MSSEERTKYLRAKGYCQYAPTCIGFCAITSDCKCYDGGSCDFALLKHDRERRGLLENHGVGGATEDIVKRLGL